MFSLFPGLSRHSALSQNHFKAFDLKIIIILKIKPLILFKRHLYKLEVGNLLKTSMSQKANLPLNQTGHYE